MVHTSIGWNPDNPVGTEMVVLNEPEASATVPDGTGIFFHPNIIFAIPTPGENPLAESVTDEPAAPALGFTNKSAIVNALKEFAPKVPAKLFCISSNPINAPSLPIKF